MRGSKESYTDRQKREAAHIEQGYEKRGTSYEEAQRRAWATVNKESGGGKQSGSGRGPESKHAQEATGHNTAANRSAAAKKGWGTRRAKAKD